MCSHKPMCPDATATDASAAIIVDDHCEQGWYRLCNGLIMFEDGVCIVESSAAAAA